MLIVRIGTRVYVIDQQLENIFDTVKYTKGSKKKTYLIPVKRLLYLNSSFIEICTFFDG